MRRKRLRIFGMLAACLLLAFLALDSRLRVVTYEVTTADVTSPVRLAVLTDLHSCAYGENQQRLLDAVDAQKPDLVALVGDIVDDVLPEENAWTTVEALAEKYPCFYVTGNHEWWTGDIQRICDQMTAHGVTVLRGDGGEVTVQGETLSLWGIDDPESGESGAQLRAVGEQAQEEGFHILLAHRPEQIEMYTQYPFDLILSGHAHGGQWRFFGRGVFAPGQGLFPKYTSGLYRGRLFVSRGMVNTVKPIPRINKKCELAVIRIVPTE